MDGPGGSGSKPRQPRKQKLTPRKEYPSDSRDLGETPRRRLAKPTKKTKKSLNRAEIEEQELVMDSDSADDVFGEEDDDELILKGLYTRGDDEDDSEDDSEYDEEDKEGEEDDNYEGSEKDENEEDENYEASEEDENYEESEDDYEIPSLPTQRKDL